MKVEVRELMIHGHPRPKAEVRAGAPVRGDCTEHPQTWACKLVESSGP